MQWTTEVPVLEDVGGLSILLGVESNKPKTDMFYVLDITDQQAGCDVRIAESA